MRLRQNKTSKKQKKNSKKIEQKTSEKKKKCHNWDSNPWCSDYEEDALPTGLRRQIHDSEQKILEFCHILLETSREICEMFFCSDFFQNRIPQNMEFGLKSNPLMLIH